MHRYKRSGLLALLFFLTFGTQAQKTPSLYSSYGIGEQYGVPFLSNIGMGGTGLSTINPTYMNFLNPAAMVFTEFTSFETGILLESKSYRTANQTDLRRSGSMGYLALGVPIIKKRWSVGATVMPHTFMDYNNTIEIDDPNLITPTRKSFTGSGGVTKASITNSVKIYKGLALGLSAHYFFGQLTRSEVTRLGEYIIAGDTVTAIYRSTLQERTNYNDFGFTTGLFYNQKLKDNKFINLAATYEIPNNLGGIRSTTLAKFDPSGNPINIGIDTSNVSVIRPESRGYSSIPARYGGSLTYGKNNRYQFAIDGYFQDWSTFEDFEVASSNMGQAFSFHLGTEFVPDYTSLDNYFARVTYRAGGHFQKSPFTVNGNEVYNFGVNFGASFPLRSFSTFNTAVEIGQMGSSQNGLVAETYIRLHLGITVLDRWFVRQKFD